MCSWISVTEGTERYMICGAGLCSIQGSVVQGGVTGSGHNLCVHIVICTLNTTVKGTVTSWGGGGGGVQETVSSICNSIALNWTTQSAARCTVVRNFGCEG